MNENRVKIFFIGYEAIAHALDGRLEITGLPEDYKIGAIKEDFYHGGFSVRVTSSTFEEVEDGVLIPTIDVQFHLKPKEEEEQDAD